VKVTYQRHIERLNERETATSLSDPEYTSLDAFLGRFGRMIALAEQHEAKPTTTVAPADRETELRHFWVQCFADEEILSHLEDAVRLLGDEEMRRDFDRMTKRAEEEELRLRRRLYPDSAF
jgi:hypothetical protein